MPEVFLRSNQKSFSVGSIFCIGRNYRKHIQELGNDVDVDPVVFLKPAASLITEGHAIELPRYSNEIHHEVEMVLLIGKQGRAIKESAALECVAGIAVGLDLTARDVQKALRERGLPWMQAKGFDTAACVSDFLSLANLPPPDSLHFSLHVNGQLRQEGDTSLMIYSAARIVSFISSIVTLLPGDLIFTGTPHGVAPIRHGDMLDLQLADTLNASFRVAPGGAQ